MRLSLKSRQRLYINGAVLRFDRRVSVDLLNDAVFLLESHVLQPDAITTPLRQIYFIAQTMLMDPTCVGHARATLRRQLGGLNGGYRELPMATVLRDVSQCIDEDRVLDALKRLRGSFAMEAELLGLASRPCESASRQESELPA